MSYAAVNYMNLKDFGHRDRDLRQRVLFHMAVGKAGGVPEKQIRDVQSMAFTTRASERAVRSAFKWLDKSGLVAQLT